MNRTKKPKNIANKAFTLAEVLVTLAIIGVVASLTIPSLMKSYQETVWKAAWKREFSNLSQGMKLTFADNNNNIIGTFTNHETLRNLVIANLKYTKTCSDPQNGVCWAQPSYTLSGARGWEHATENMSSAVLVNGATLKAIFKSSDCTDNTFVNNSCGHLYIDVNGLKGPNTAGKDIYIMAILKDRLVPFGVDPVNSYTDPAITCIEGSTTTTNLGSGCAAKYLYN